MAVFVIWIVVLVCGVVLGLSIRHRYSSNPELSVGTAVGFLSGIVGAMLAARWFWPAHGGVREHIFPIIGVILGLLAGAAMASFPGMIEDTKLRAVGYVIFVLLCVACLRYLSMSPHSIHPPPTQRAVTPEEDSAVAREMELNNPSVAAPTGANAEVPVPSRSGAPGTIPPMLDVNDDYAYVMVRPVGSSELSVSLSRIARGGDGVRCEMHAATKLEDDHTPTPLGERGATVFKTSDRNCEHPETLLLEFSVYSRGRLIWRTDSLESAQIESRQ